MGERVGERFEQYAIYPTPDGVLMKPLYVQFSEEGGDVS